MDFRFTDEQEMTAEALRALLADLCQPADLRRLLASGEPRDTARWARIVEMGLHGALVGAAHGGLGLAAADFVLVAEECGLACLPEPLVGNAGVALPLLADISGEKRATALLERALAGEITIAVDHPANPFIADADTASAILSVRGDVLHLVDTASVALVRQPSIDPFRRLFSIAEPPSADSAVAEVNAVRPHLDATLDRGALFAAAEFLGIAQRAIDLAVAYAGERVQFGKPIGSYQAIKHMLSSAQVKIEFARPVVYAAAAQLPNTDAFSRARISHAKLAAAEAADLATRTSLQVHGAMGYSWEVDVHFFLKRALALASHWGDSRFHCERVAARAFSFPLGAEHTFDKETVTAAGP